METREGVIWGAPVGTVENIIVLLEELVKTDKGELQHEINKKLPSFARAVSSLFENAHSFKWENKKVRALGKKVYMKDGNDIKKEMWMYKKFKKNQDALDEITDILITIAQVLVELNPMINIDLSRMDSTIIMAEADEDAFEKDKKSEIAPEEVKEDNKFKGVISRINKYTAILQKHKKVKDHEMDDDDAWPQELRVSYWTGQTPAYEVSTRGKTKGDLAEELEAMRDKT